MTNSSKADNPAIAQRRESSDVKKRYRRDRRPKSPKPMHFTDNDRAIIGYLYDYRLLTQQQIEQLLGRSRSTVQEKLIRLYHHKFVDRIFLSVRPGVGRSPTLYVLDKAGFDVLRAEGIEDFSGFPKANVSGLFLEHTIAINDVRIAVTLACQQLGWSILEWQSENQIKAEYERVGIKTRGGKQSTIPIVPDSYFVIEIPERGNSHFFLELDRGTMTQSRFRQKVIGYVAYLKLDITSRRFKSQGLRILTVTDKVNRFPRLVETAAGVQGIGNRLWFARLPDIRPETVLTEPIWHIAGLEQTRSLFSN